MLLGFSLVACHVIEEYHGNVRFANKCAYNTLKPGRIKKIPVKTNIYILHATLLRFGVA